jgi:methylated-DNA-[protein]-cysteine S-methyltransferase
MHARRYFTSPLGDILILASEKGLTHVLFTTAVREEEIPNEITEQCMRELDEYFFKGRKFFDIELDVHGTDFQKRVWSELTAIPFGKTISYEELAIRIGDIKTIRAVGVANSQNPIAIIVPCHRVIGKNGDLTGYAGGLENKEWLLYHEGSLLKQLTLF